MGLPGMHASKAAQVHIRFAEWKTPLWKSLGFGCSDALLKDREAGKEAKTVTKKCHVGATPHFLGPDGETQKYQRPQCPVNSLCHCTEQDRFVML